MLGNWQGPTMNMALVFSVGMMPAAMLVTSFAMSMDPTAVLDTPAKVLLGSSMLGVVGMVLVQAWIHARGSVRWRVPSWVMFALLALVALGGAGIGVLDARLGSAVLSLLGLAGAAIQMYLIEVGFFEVPYPQVPVDAPSDG